jgi:molybdenum cofactor biosynthesis enzyme
MDVPEFLSALVELDHVTILAMVALAAIALAVLTVYAVYRIAMRRT